MKTDNEQKYDVSILKLIRNNNIATGTEIVKDYDTYFMLDYFDLLCHRNLISGDKVYKKFWDFSDNRDIKKLNYKAACKMLSLYTKRGGNEDSIFHIDENEGNLSRTPFLGVIQINIVHYIYSRKYGEEEFLEVCEERLRECVEQIISLSKEKCNYRLYRSSTSGDFCLIVKSAAINVVFKLASSINNLVIQYEEQDLILNTYTNLGIECLMDAKQNFYSFLPETVAKNQMYTFALRFTASNDYAKKLYDRISNTRHEKEIVIEPMEGLFGRYDFLLYLSMPEFAEIYPTLCKSKIVGWDKEEVQAEKNASEFLALLQEGIWNGEIRVINERVLVPLEETFFNTHKLHNSFYGGNGYIGKKEQDIALSVQQVNQKFESEMKRFNELEQLFTEERRGFIDISRELWEVISTYVPQGMERDAHVNWQILVSDLSVTFECIHSWFDLYKRLQSDDERKLEREYFLTDLRRNVDAINRFYTFLQNVNAQTWQSPLYEIQTQLDVEKMMIAYREFLHEYFEIYNNINSGSGHKCMLNPIVYPDMMIDRACAMEPFKRYDTETRLLICKVPSFEYYGRMFDMIPWILHEASHSLRTMERAERNNYLIHAVVKSVLTQMMYEFLNRYSNDFGYHKLGNLETDIIDIIKTNVIEVFHTYLKEEKNVLVSDLALDFLETELQDFLCIMFDRDFYNMANKGYVVDMNEIKRVLLDLLSRLGIISPTDVKYSSKLIEKINEIENKKDYLLDLLKLIYDTYYMQATGREPEQKDEWEILVQGNYAFEYAMTRITSHLSSDVQPEAIRDFYFSMRELRRIYYAYLKDSANGSQGEKIRKSVWEQSIPEIKMKMKNGFQQNEGFTELYRILNMIFGAGRFDGREINRVGDEFNILYQEMVKALAEREIKIYREACADIYVAAALGLDAFGYCRQTFQTVSDSGIKEGAQWIDAVNIHRFSIVAAVLLGGDTKPYKGKIRIPIDQILESGQEYCYETIECIKKTEAFECITGQEKELAQQFLDDIQDNIQVLFDLFHENISVQKMVRNSLISLYLEQDADEHMQDPDVQKARNKVVEQYGEIWKKLRGYQHVIYRIKCFILLLDMIGHNGYIEVNAIEYEHLSKLYNVHKKNYEAFAQTRCCRNVAEYYNNPRSAKEKTHEIMLENTLDFIQMYYYKNRIKIMASDKTKKVGNTNGMEIT